MRSMSASDSVAVGSSRISTRASRASKRAISISWRWPMVSELTGRSRSQSPSPSVASACCARARKLRTPVQERDFGAAEPDVVENRQMRREAQLLRHQSEPEALRLLRPADRPDFAVDGDRAAVRLDDAHQNLDEACSCRRRSRRRARESLPAAGRMRHLGVRSPRDRPCSRSGPTRPPARMSSQAIPYKQARKPRAEAQ